MKEKKCKMKFKPLRLASAQMNEWEEHVFFLFQCHGIPLRRAASICSVRSASFPVRQKEIGSPSVNETWQPTCLCSEDLKALSQLLRVRT